MPRALLSNGIELEYDSFGTPSDPVLLLIQGLAGQLIDWDEGFCELLAAGGYHVIRFDNRDCGLSSAFDGVQAHLGAVMAAALAEQPVPPVPYTLSDMASDAVGLLDHLGVVAAHVLGVSMGGMIAQVLAIEHPDRVRSLISVMSMTGELTHGAPSHEALALVLSPPPVDAEASIARAGDAAIWSSKRYFDLDATRARVAQRCERRFYPEGPTRQLAAIYASGPRTEGLSKLALPTFVIHGLDDALITPSGGQRTAELVSGSTLLLVADMGHDLPEPLWPLVSGAVVGFCRTVDATLAVTTPAPV